MKPGRMSVARIARLAMGPSGACLEGDTSGQFGYNDGRDEEEVLCVFLQWS